MTTSALLARILRAARQASLPRGRAEQAAVYRTYTKGCDLPADPT
jgi:hypothetical protein